MSNNSDDIYYCKILLFRYKIDRLLFSIVILGFINET